MTAVRQPSSRRQASRHDRSLPYINRELSWLDFNARILQIAQDERNPLLERARFLAIFASNLDEFFQVRVAGLKQQTLAGHSSPSPDGLSAQEVLAQIRNRVLQLQTLQSITLNEVRAGLADEGIRIVPLEDRSERQNELRQRFLAA